MNAPIPVAEPGKKSGGALWLLFVFAFLVSLVAISDQSLWIDEALTACKARQPTFAGWWHAIVTEKASDLQMPLYMIFMWVYEKAFGSSEWVLRTANLPWFAVGMLAFVTAFSSARQRAFAALVTAGSPFVWYYLNEARPYAMQLGAALLIFAALYRLSRVPNSQLQHCERSRGGQGEEAESLGNASTVSLRRLLFPRISSSADSDAPLWVWGFFLGIIVLCGSSMLGMIWAAAALTVTVVVFPRTRLAEMVRLHRLMCLAAGGFLLLLGGYYLWTLKVGARASGAATTDWKNLPFIGYEVLGFSGLGPGRLVIRESGLDVFQRHWIELALYAVTVLALLGAAVRQLFQARDRKELLSLVLVIVAPAVVLMTAGWVLHFRVLGRHFTPLMPVVLFVLSTGLAALWSHRGFLRKLVVCGFFLLSLFSCLSLRFAARHEKDNYRDAAIFARTALQSGKQVWWNADNQAATYYEVPTSNQPAENGKAWRVINPSRELLWFAPKPEVIITSKPDLFDSQRALSDYIALTRFDKVATLPAFTIWQRSAK